MPAAQRSPLDILSSQLHPVGIPADLESLRLVARVWGRGSTVILRDGTGEARVSDGRVLSGDGHTRIVRGMYRGGLEAVPWDSTRRGGADLGRDVWRAACASARPQRVLECLDAAPVGRPLLRRLGDIPVLDGTRQVLKVRGDGPLLARCQAAGVRPEAIAPDLSALVAMGALRLQRVPTTPLRAVVDPRVLEARLEARLEREWQIVRKADDWTVLGITPQASPDVRRRAGERQRARYRAAALEGTLRTRELARRILGRVEGAIRAIEQGRAMSGVDHAVRADPLGEGRKRLAVGDFANAAKCFALARKRSETAQNIALLGWALYNDRTRPKQRRTRKGLELLALAESMGGHASEVQLLRARAEVLEGDLVRAWNRLDRLCEHDASDAEARELLAQVRSELGR